MSRLDVELFEKVLLDGNDVLLLYAIDDVRLASSEYDSGLEIDCDADAEAEYDIDAFELPV